MSAKVLARIEKLALQARELQAAGKYAEAEPLLTVISLAKLVHGENHPEVLRAEMNLAVSYRRRGDTALSLPILERVSDELSHHLADPEGAYLYRTALNNLAASLRWTGNLGKARAALEFCLSLIELALPLGDETAPEEHARVLDNLADVLIQQGELEAAEPYARRGVSEWRELRGDDAVEVAFPTSHLGLILMRRGQLAEARELLERSLQLLEKHLGTDHPTVGEMLNLMGTLGGPVWQSRRRGGVLPAIARDREAPCP
jgi:tetratricopeptide (TPR) repeat protein